MSEWKKAADLSARLIYILGLVETIFCDNGIYERPGIDQLE